MIWIALRNVLKKKQRTRLSLIAIVLSTAIIYTSSVLIVNLVDFSTNKYSNQFGNFHYAIKQNEDIELSSHYEVTKEWHTDFLGFYDGKNYELCVLENSDVLPFAIVEGQLPKNKNEILVS